jgi:hypothetical protein
MIKRLSILLSILCLCAADVGWAASKNSQTVGNIYYLRADGTAANKAAATSGSSPSTAMSVTTHNSETFEAGDHIRLGDTGGTYKKSIIAPSSGKDGHPIVYEAAPGQHPVIDLTMDIGTGGWAGPDGNGVYTKSGYGRVLWEDGVALPRATSTACTDGNWYYLNASLVLQYKPTSGTPASHTSIQTIWYYDANWGPYAFDLRERSNIDVSGLTINRGSIGVAQNVSNSASTLIKNIKIYDCTFNQSLWAIWGQVVLNNCIFQDAEFYNNTINYSNGGISIWTGSAMVSHTQHPLRVNIHHNTINHHYSIDANHNWTYAIGTVVDDHEGISFQDPVSCTVSHNQITCDLPMDGNNHRRGIFLYLNPHAPSMNNNIVTYNKIIGGYDLALYVIGNPPNSAQGNIIACNVLQSNIGYYPDCYALFIKIPSNSASGINYLCNNTINYSVLTSGIYIPGPDSGKWTIENNIVSTTRWVSMVGTVTTKSDYIFSYNNYYSTSGSPFYYSGSSRTFAFWKALAATWDNTGSFVGDPLLNASDSSLTATSPGKNAGTPIEGITVSGGVGLIGIDDKAFDPKHPSMGAYAQPVGYR